MEEEVRGKLREGKRGFERPSEVSGAAALSYFLFTFIPFLPTFFLRSSRAQTHNTHKKKHTHTHTLRDENVRRSHLVSAATIPHRKSPDHPRPTRGLPVTPATATMMTELSGTLVGGIGGGIRARRGTGEKKKYFYLFI